MSPEPRTLRQLRGWTNRLSPTSASCPSIVSRTTTPRRSLTSPTYAELANSHSWLWLHLNLSNRRCHDRLSRSAPLSDVARETLLVPTSISEYFRRGHRRHFARHASGVLAGRRQSRTGTLCDLVEGPLDASHSTRPSSQGVRLMAAAGFASRCRRSMRSSTDLSM